MVLGGWLVVAWQILVSVSIGLQLTYVLIVLGLAAAVVWLRRGRPALDRRMLAATSAGVALMLVCSALLAAPLARVANAHPEARRSTSELNRRHSELSADASRVERSGACVVALAEPLLWADSERVEHAAAGRLAYLGSCPCYLRRGKGVASPRLHRFSRLVPGVASSSCRSARLLWSRSR